MLALQPEQPVPSTTFPLWDTNSGSGSGSASGKLGDTPLNQAVALLAAGDTDPEIQWMIPSWRAFYMHRRRPNPTLSGQLKPNSPKALPPVVSPLGRAGPRVYPGNWHYWDIPACNGWSRFAGTFVEGVQ